MAGRSPAERSPEFGIACKASPHGGHALRPTLAACARQGCPDVDRVYELVNANQAAAKVATLCRVLGVSARGCYA